MHVYLYKGVGAAEVTDITRIILIDIAEPNHALVSSRVAYRSVPT